MILFEELLEELKKLPHAGITYNAGRKNDRNLQEKIVTELLEKLDIRYQFQPNGPQRSPDFNLFDFNYDLEIKTIRTNGRNPKLNGRRSSKLGTMYLLFLE